jgi:hypothetical protein
MTWFGQRLTSILNYWVNLERNTFCIPESFNTKIPFQLFDHKKSLWIQNTKIQIQKVIFTCTENQLLMFVLKMFGSQNYIRPSFGMTNYYIYFRLKNLYTQHENLTLNNNELYLPNQIWVKNITFEKNNKQILKLKFIAL